MPDIDTILTPTTKDTVLGPIPEAKPPGVPEPTPEPQAQPGAGEKEIPAAVEAAKKEWPVLAPHLDNFKIQFGDTAAGDQRQLEYYPPWETDNPNPGKSTIEIYRKDMSPDELKSAIAGDALHHLGSVDPRTNSPVDPKFMALKVELGDSLTPKQLAIDRKVYAEEGNGDGRSFDDWMHESRLDAYIRGYLTPDKVDEWRKQNTYTPEQKATLNKMQAYLSGKSEGEH